MSNDLRWLIIRLETERQNLIGKSDPSYRWRREALEADLSILKSAESKLDKSEERTRTADRMYDKMQQERDALASRLGTQEWELEQLRAKLKSAQREALDAEISARNYSQIAADYEKRVITSEGRLGKINDVIQRDVPAGQTQMDFELDCLRRIIDIVDPCVVERQATKDASGVACYRCEKCGTLLATANVACWHCQLTAP